MPRTPFQFDTMQLGKQSVPADPDRADVAQKDCRRIGRLSAFRERAWLSEIGWECASRAGRYRT